MSRDLQNATVRTAPTPVARHLIVVAISLKADSVRESRLARRYTSRFRHIVIAKFHHRPWLEHN
jgi:hypothetical protein